MNKSCLAALLLFAATGAQAAPLTLSYGLTDLGGSYQYDFTLTLDNNDGSFVAGHSFDWIIIGDGGPNASPFAEGGAFFTGLPAGWSGTTSYGGHNGPTLGAVDDFVLGTYWTPLLGESVSFTGVSSTLVDEGDLKWAFLVGSGNGAWALNTAVLKDEPGVSPVPLPAGLPLLFGALAPLALLRRRRQTV